MVRAGCCVVGRRPFGNRIVRRSLVKEVVSWAWNPPYGANTDCGENEDYLGCGINWTKISSIEYKGEFSRDVSRNSGNPIPVGLEKIKDLPGFNGDPFRLSNTMGMQRVVAPPGN